MEDKGWIKLHRQVRDHWLFSEKREFSRFEAFTDLLLSAAYKDTTVIIKSCEVHLKRGQFAETTKYFEDRWNWTRKKVRAFFDALTCDNMAEIQGIDKKYSIITIANYSIYQAKEEGPSQGPSEGPRETAQPRGFEHGEGPSQGPREGPSQTLQPAQGADLGASKNIKNIKNNTISIKETVEIIHEHYLKTFKGLFKVYSLTTRRYLMIEEVVQEWGYSLDDILNAISNLRLSEWHINNNKKDLETIFRKPETLEHWINYKPANNVLPFRSRQDNFNNYQQREFDDSLEDKLLNRDQIDTSNIDVMEQLKAMRGN